VVLTSAVGTQTLQIEMNLVGVDDINGVATQSHRARFSWIMIEEWPTLLRTAKM
jgi:hypothetical protein